jgi:hypothetical protein
MRRIKPLKSATIICLAALTMLLTAGADNPCPDTIVVECALSPLKLYQVSHAPSEYSMYITDSIVGEINKRKGAARKDYLGTFSPTFKLTIRQLLHKPGCLPQTYRIDTIRIVTSGFEFDPQADNISQSFQVGAPQKKKKSAFDVCYVPGNELLLGGPSATDKTKEYKRKIFIADFLSELLEREIKNKRLVITFRFHLAVDIVNASPIEVEKTMIINIIRAKKEVSSKKPH